MADRMRECLRSLRRNHKVIANHTFQLFFLGASFVLFSMSFLSRWIMQDEDARVRRAFETLLTCIGNVVKKDDEKYRRIRLSNPVVQVRQFLKMLTTQILGSGQPSQLFRGRK